MKDSFRSSKAKMTEKPEFTGVNEDFEIIFNTAGVGNMNRTKIPSCFISIPTPNTLTLLPQLSLSR